MKEKVESTLSLGPAANQKLIFAGKILKNDQTVADCNIKENDFLVVMVSKAKRKAPTPSEEKADTPAPTAAPVSAATSATTTDVPAPAPAAAAPALAAPAPAATAPPTTTPAPAPVAAAAPAPAEAPAAAAPAAPTDYQSAASNLVVGPEFEAMVANLMALGFPHERVVQALRASFNNPDRAAEYLFTVRLVTSFPRVALSHAAST